MVSVVYTIKIDVDKENKMWDERSMNTHTHTHIIQTLQLQALLNPCERMQYYS